MKSASERLPTNRVSAWFNPIWRSYNMRTLLASFLILFLGLVQNASAEETHVALFKNVSGDIRILRGKTEIPALAGTHIRQADVVVSGLNSSAGIAFHDGTLLTVGPSSEIEISRFLFKPEDAKYDFSVLLRKGQAIYSSGKIGKLSPESVSVNTPRATVGVRGTRFIITAD